MHDERAPFIAAGAAPHLPGQEGQQPSSARSGDASAVEGAGGRWPAADGTGSSRSARAEAGGTGGAVDDEMAGLPPTSQEWPASIRTGASPVRRKITAPSLTTISLVEPLTDAHDEGGANILDLAIRDHDQQTARRLGVLHLDRQLSLAELHPLDRPRLRSRPACARGGEDRMLRRPTRFLRVVRASHPSKHQECDDRGHGKPCEHDVAARTTPLLRHLRIRTVDVCEKVETTTPRGDLVDRFGRRK